MRMDVNFPESCKFHIIVSPRIEFYAKRKFVNGLPSFKPTWDLCVGTY